MIFVRTNQYKMANLLKRFHFVIHKKPGQSPKKGIKPGFSAQRHLIANFDWLVINRIWILGGQNKFLKLRQGIGHFAIASSNNQIVRQRPPVVLRYIGARFLHSFTDRRKSGVVRVMATKFKGDRATLSARSKKVNRSAV